MPKQIAQIIVLHIVVLLGARNLAAQDFAVGSHADQAWPQAPAVHNNIVPGEAASGQRLIRFNGRAMNAAGRPVTDVAGVTFAIYSEQSGGAALWQETQNLATDVNGRFSALLGATSTTGVPSELFSTGEARWLGVLAHSPGVSEQPRVLLVSVPYALKAADSEMLGGKPASAYMTADSQVATMGGCAESGRAGAEPGSPVIAAKAMPAIASSGAIGGYLPIFTDTLGNLANSIVVQSGSNLGIGTSTPSSLLHAVSGVSDFRFNTGAAALTPTMAVISTTGKAGAVLAGTSGTAFTFDNSGFFTILAETHDNFVSNNLGRGSQLLTVLSNGNVGIGTTVPGGKLQVNAGDFIKSTTTGINGVQDNLFKYMAQGDVGARSNRWIGADATISAGDASANKLLFRIYQGAAAQDQPPLNVMSLQGDGHVGIGTSAPDQMLTVNGSIHSTSGGFIFPDGSVMSTAPTGTATLPPLQPGGNLVLAAGNGSGGVGNLQLQTAGNDANTMSDRLLIAGNPKAMTGVVPTANLFSLHIPAGDGAGGRVKFTIVASDGTNYALETGEIAYLADPQQLTCNVVISEYSKAPPAYTNGVLAIPAIGQTGALNAQCNPTYFGNDPGVQIFDTAPTSFTATTHKVYYTIENQSQASITLQP